jgi:hypothetical protein
VKGRDASRFALKKIGGSRRNENAQPVDVLYLTSSVPTDSVPVLVSVLHLVSSSSSTVESSSSVVGVFGFYHTCCNDWCSASRRRINKLLLYLSKSRAETFVGGCEVAWWQLQPSSSIPQYTIHLILSVAIGVLLHLRSIWYGFGA